MADNEFVEDVASSLVREYLSRKGLRSTLSTMDEEMPRCETSISNRQALMKQLHLGELMKKNKESSSPLRAMLEVMTRSFLDTGSTTRSPARTPDSLREYGNIVPQKARSAHEDAVDRGYPMKSTPSSDSLDSESTYMTSRTRPTTAHLKAKTGSRSNDLVIDDNVDSETLLGEGKAALMDKPSSRLSNDSSDTLTGAQIRPRSAVKSRGLGMAGTISSNLDDSKQKFHKPRSSGITGRTKEKQDIVPVSNFSSLLDSYGSSSIDNSRFNNEKLVTESKQFNGVARDFDPERNPSPSSLGNITAKSKKQQVADLFNADRERTKSYTDKKREMMRLEQELSPTVTPPEIEAASYNVSSSSISTESHQLQKSRNGSTSSLSRKGSQSSITAPTKLGDLEIGDVDDLDGELSNLDLAPRVQVSSLSKMWEGFPIDMQTAINLKVLIFGSATQCFNNEWRNQSFTFSDLPKLGYGIVQKKGGPCGVLAAVQAIMLQQLLFSEGRVPCNRWSDPSREERSRYLSTALAKIFWRAGEQRKAVVAVPGRKAHFHGGGRFKSDDLTETLTLYSFTDQGRLLTFVKQAINQFELDGNSGVISALYSVILSRGFDQTVKDMDEPSNTLMGAHGYCTQEMVNLLVTGRCVSNVFNDVMELDSGGVGPPMLLKGLNGRSDIGFLSLFEHYKSCQVGTYYKTPRHPIWIVCSESHFSVLFSIKKDLVNDWKAERRFHLFYYDGLSRQDEQIQLTIDTKNRYYHPPSDNDLVSPLEHCIRTKWKDAEIDWNGTEPIL